MTYITTILFFTVPIVLFVFFGICLCRFVYAKNKNKKTPNAFSDKEMKKRLILLIISSTLAGIMLAIIMGIIALLYSIMMYM